MFNLFPDYTEKWRNQIIIDFKQQNLKFTARMVIPFCSQKDDFIILKLERIDGSSVDIPEPRNKSLAMVDMDKDIPDKWTTGSYKRLEGQQEREMIFVPGCPVFNDRQKRCDKLQEIGDFWAQKAHNKSGEITISKTDEIIIRTQIQWFKDNSDLQTLFQCDKDVTYGASGSPCIDVDTYKKNVKKPNNRVVAMYLGCIPKTYYGITANVKSEEINLYINNRLERAINMKRVRDVLQSAHLDNSESHATLKGVFQLH